MIFDSVARAMVICKAIDCSAAAIICVALLIFVYKLLKHFV